MRSRIVEIICGLIALALLAALLAGLPAALIMVVGWPLPTEVPGWDEFDRLITTGELDTWTLIKALAVLVWLAWGQLTLSVVAEAIAIVRGRRAAHTPSARPLRLAAANLVATAALLFGTVGRIGPVGAVEPPVLDVGLVAAASASIPSAGGAGYEQLRTIPTPDSTLVRHGGGNNATALEVADPTFWRVEARDTLWGIAETTLGDGMRWREIRDLNVGREQPDGGALGASGDLIRPGWLLRLPQDARMERPAATPAGRDVRDAPDDSEVSITVAPGDTLWGLAGAHLDDPYRWPDLYEANRGRLQPDGRRLTDPDLIHPGWQLSLPSSPKGNPTPVSEDEEVRDRTGQSDSRRPHEPAPDPGVGEQPLPGAQTAIPWALLQDEAPSQAPQPREEVLEPAPSEVESPLLEFTPDVEVHPGGTEQAESADDVDGWQDGLLLVAGAGLAAAGVIATLDRLRRTRQRRRGPGERLQPPDSELADAERRIRGLADAATAERLAISLRALAAGCAKKARVPPDIALVSVSDHDVAVHLATSDPDPPDGWTVRDDGTTWVLPRPTDLEALQQLASSALSPAPLLASIGTHASTRRRVLLNLGHACRLNVDADPEAGRTLLLGAAIELATCGRAAGLEVLLVGGHDQLSTLERVRCVDEAETIDLLRDAADRDDPESPADAATAALFLTPPSSDVQRALGALALDTGDIAVAGMGIRDAAWAITIGADSIRIEPHGLEVEPLELTSHDLDRITQLLIKPAAPDYAVADPPDHGPEQLPEGVSRNGDTPTPTEPVNEPDAADTESSIEVRILGPVEVAGAGEFASAKAEELVVYLAIHRNGDDSDSVNEALWPERQPNQGRLHTTAWRARQALGNDPDRQPLFPRAKQGRYRLSQRVGLDYQRFREHVARASSHPERTIDELRGALELVRGRPLSATSGEYAWATYDVHTIEQEISDTAHELAQLHLELEEPEQSRWAAERGLIADPYCELLYRDLMHAAAKAGNTTEAHGIMQRLRDLLSDDGDANDSDDHLDPATIELFDQLVHTQTSSARARPSTETKATSQ